MNTPQNSRRSAIPSALAIGAVLIALSMPTADAGPGGGDTLDSDNQPGVPGVVQPPAPIPNPQASENPVNFMPGEKVKRISFDWTPQPTSEVRISVIEGHVLLSNRYLPPGAHGPLRLDVRYPETYRVSVCNTWQLATFDSCPPLIITTHRIEVADPTITPIPEIAVIPQGQ